MKDYLRSTVLILVSTVGIFSQPMIVPPKATVDPEPQYPLEAGTLGYGGKVFVQIEVNKKGKVKIKNVFGPLAPCSKLDDPTINKIRNAVIEAAKNLQFEPGTQDGKPVNVSLSLIYSFDETGKPLRKNPPIGKIVEAGVLQGRVRFLAKPDYTLTAKANRASGSVPVMVLTDFDGRIIAATARGGHALLRNSATQAACTSSIEPVFLSGKAVQVYGTLTYYFVL